jgi:hypothetical protein
MQNHSLKQQINKLNFFYYAILGIPLAFIALPLNINIADFYFRQFQLSLSNLALIILLAKSLDLLLDPLIGGCCDYWLNHQKTTAKTIIIFAVFLPANYYWWFLLISFSSGAFLGADIILPPTIIANLIGSNNPQTSSYTIYTNKYHIITKYYI